MKTFALQVDRTSWTCVPQGLRKSCPFPSPQRTASIDFNGALLWMGKMSVPLQLPQWELATQWAKIRYYAAAGPTADLRLRTIRNSNTFIADWELIAP